MKTNEELRNETLEAIMQFKSVYGDRTEIDEDLLTDCEIEPFTGLMEFCGMTQTEYTEWLNNQKKAEG